MELEKQLNGGGELEGVGVRVAVKEEAAESELRRVGVESRPVAERDILGDVVGVESRPVAERDNLGDAEELAFCDDCELCDGREEGVDAFESKKQFEAPAALQDPVGQSVQALAFPALKLPAEQGVQYTATDVAEESEREKVPLGHDTVAVRKTKHTPAGPPSLVNTKTRLFIPGDKLNANADTTPNPAAEYERSSGGAPLTRIAK